MENVSLVLSRNDVGQLVEGIEVLIEQWEATAEYLETGCAPDDVCIRESHSAHEARSIAAIYSDLRDRIQKQIAVAR